MARTTVTLSEVREQETANTLKWVGVGVAIMLVAAFMIYFLGLFLKDNHSLLKVMRLGMGVGIVIGAVVVGGAAARLSKVRSMESFAYPCPYCDAINQLVEEPTANFECETCHQTVRFDENGVLVPVRVIGCSKCGTDNRVSIKSSRFICSKCNATIQVQAEQPVYGMGNAMSGTSGATASAASAPSRPAPTLLNQPGPSHVDVAVQSFDAARESQLAALLQNMMGIELAEARRLLGTIGARTPLIIGVDMPVQEADQLSAQLTQLGAHVHLRSR